MKPESFFQSSSPSQFPQGLQHACACHRQHILNGLEVGHFCRALKPFSLRYQTAEATDALYRVCTESPLWLSQKD